MARSTSMEGRPIQIADFGVPDIAGDLTVEAWIRLDGAQPHSRRSSRRAIGVTSFA
jgi:hypothetical protein